MPNPADRISVVTSTGLDPAFELSPAQCQELAAIIDQSIGEAGILEMILICRSYLRNRQTELRAAKKSEASAIWVETKNRVLNFVEIAEGTYPPFTDAGRIVENAFFEGLPAGPAVAGEMFYPNRDALMKVAAVLRVAIDNAERELTHGTTGFDLGSAFADWLRDMQAWAAANGFSCGAGGKEQANAFCNFLFALNGYFPAQLRTPVNSAEAMTARLIRLRKANTSAS